ncbi:MAG: ArsR family transcriptional regulator, partial [Desulfovibrio sp.]
MKKIIYQPAEQDKDSPALDSAAMEELAEMCKGLAHPARVAILAYLKSVDRCI